MNTQENNKLIAEFMGIIPNEAGVYHVSEHKGYSLENLLYHTSWDWLMPVLQKCRKKNQLEYFDVVYYALEECDINITYKAVVEFIKQLNK
ncbi:MAG: hypothetical protein Unbinned2299contig1000_54 [Prokaryotic dsDNA virus sp.]|nr:MAG: hypothetical protein Unbinned2299contig1000_54 [Prokaryotic dsDNA virus sp.]|tara:strand:+ start:303 stop:575 length:273 start_codon:yes stop_codon:yes gene_type:complete